MRPILDVGVSRPPRVAPADPPFEGRHVHDDPDTWTKMLVRRDGSIDLRVLAGRLGVFLATSSLAVGVGAAIAIATA